MDYDISNARSIVILTGAGISAESGVNTFRASDGLWENHPVEDVATPEGFARNPELVQYFYNARRRQLSTVEPNAAHVALADFERRFDGRFLLITQNVDDLHERAGSNNLLHMHGELLKARCTACDSVHTITGDLSLASICGVCQSQGTVRPDIVWFGEIPMEMERIYNALTQCDLFVSIGTSGNVYPAAGFAQEAKNTGATTVELNLDPSVQASTFDYCLHGLATEIVPAFLTLPK
ncbi:Sir2 family NAD+-dependent deacetylase [Sansalvadorimonas verongulae]|uniref:Sir2 family NAD+-dependent deacetylase n=1 Tax=Sansalvadorimonas verongulae TaxID=2172824 RepID=UPI0012BCBAD1|nr:Sir2 family NAD+-dependent deacetylase [Sansalvadorimonas verongulae]MTI13947.1 NAD-dependent protein deacylase [Sansalvadorimonas verongulae]